jgi:glutathione S-transferase
LQSRPILWTFRRCPFAMRARLAIHASGVQVDLREILLRDKPAAFLATSAKGTVPVIDTGDRVIAESRDIMLWALGQRDPEDWLAMPQDGHDLMDHCDGPFKTALDHTKYAVRYPDLDMETERAKALDFLHDQDARSRGSGFAAQDMPDLTRWLDNFKASARFAAVMWKYPPWQSGQDQVLFP